MDIAPPATHTASFRSTLRGTLAPRWNQWNCTIRVPEHNVGNHCLQTHSNSLFDAGKIWSELELSFPTRPYHHYPRKRLIMDYCLRERTFQSFTLTINCDRGLLVILVPVAVLITILDLSLLAVGHDQGTGKTRTIVALLAAPPSPLALYSAPSRTSSHLPAPWFWLWNATSFAS